MSKSEGQGHKYGPISSPMESIPGSSHDAAESCVYNGVPGYPKGTGGEIKEVTFDTGGQFGKVKPVKE